MNKQVTKRKFDHVLVPAHYTVYSNLYKFAHSVVTYQQFMPIQHFINKYNMSCLYNTSITRQRRIGGKFATRVDRRI